MPDSRSTEHGGAPMTYAVRWLKRPGRRDDGQYVDVLLSLWSYLDDESRGALVRQRPPSAPALLAAYRWARASAPQEPPADTPDRHADRRSDGREQTA